MPKISQDLFKYIQERAEDIKFGTITLEFSETGNFIRVMVTEEKRFTKSTDPVPKKYLISKTFNNG